MAIVTEFRNANILFFFFEAKQSDHSPSAFLHRIHGAGRQDCLLVLPSGHILELDLGAAGGNLVIVEFQEFVVGEENSPFSHHYWKTILTLTAY